jgi:hypothetical protein
MFPRLMALYGHSPLRIHSLGSEKEGGNTHPYMIICRSGDRVYSGKGH